MINPVQKMYAQWTKLQQTNAIFDVFVNEIFRNWNKIVNICFNIIDKFELWVIKRCYGRKSFIFVFISDMNLLKKKIQDHQ